MSQGNHEGDGGVRRCVVEVEVAWEVKMVGRQNLPVGSGATLILAVPLVVVPAAAKGP